MEWETMPQQYIAPIAAPNEGEVVNLCISDEVEYSNNTDGEEGGVSTTRRRPNTNASRTNFAK